MSIFSLRLLLRGVLSAVVLLGIIVGPAFSQGAFRFAGLDQIPVVQSLVVDHTDREPELFDRIDFLESSQQSSSFVDDVPQDIVIRGQSPQILSQILPLVFRLYPDRLIDQADDLLAFANRLTSAGTSNWGGHFRSDITYDSSGLNRLGGNLLLSSALPLGVDTEFYYREVELATGGDGDLLNGDVNIIYKLDAHSRYKFRTGAGVNWRETEAERPK